MSGPTSGLPLLGAHVAGTGTRFGVLVTRAERCAVRLFASNGSASTTHVMRPIEHGYFSLDVANVGHGQRYKFVVDDRELTDPYARFLPDGVHGPAMVVSSDYPWRHGRGAARPLAEQVIYELHVGTFTPEGTYAAARSRLSYLAELGVTTVELMPVAAFAGLRGRGYDGVAHYAPFAPYGHPEELRRLIDEAHGLGLCVLLDVVYNHFGPAGNYLSAYSSSYLTRDFATPWGEAPDFRNPAMRHYVVDNARYWIDEFRFDGLRLDATHAICDPSPRHVLRELADTLRQCYPRALIVAEDERNEPGLVRELGSDAIWVDDFHHHVRVTLTGEQEGYYAAYAPGVSELARVIARGFSYEGQVYPPSGKVRGKRADGLEAERFVYCIQNHDQIGNRAHGTRLCHDATLDAYCVASTLLLFLPMTPLLFMGQEWGASSPFLFFTDHDAELGALVTNGRRREFAAFAEFSNPAKQAEIPDPQALDTFERSRVVWDEHVEPPHSRVLALYRSLLELRAGDPVFELTRSRKALHTAACGDALVVERRAKDGRRRVLVANFASDEVRIGSLPGLGGSWELLLATRPIRGDLIPPMSAAILAFDSSCTAALGSH